MRNDENDQSTELQRAVREAFEAGRPLAIRGSDSKNFYGRQMQGEPLSLTGHHGVIRHEPTELFVTVRAGTPLAELEQALASHDQHLPFEPPAFGPGATIGGTLACGLSGPARPYRGAARDAVLGMRILNGKGELLSFGGEVMKNVAGYDVSRLMVGALGTLGVILEASIKVLPRPAAEETLSFELSAQDAIIEINRWSATPVPLSGACYSDGRLYVRLSGSPRGVAAARSRLGGEAMKDATAFWTALREQTLPFFTEGVDPLWRIAVPAAAPPLPVSGTWLLDWGGAQRWLRSGTSPEELRAAAAHAGGHAMLFRRGDDAGEVFAPLPTTLRRLHSNLKQSFDPGRILNPGRLYADL
jgi:glycolate oxidase FAD binding subunit